jgi:hypothetical protein
MADLSTQINLNMPAAPAAETAPPAIPNALPIGASPQEAAALDAPVHVLDPYGRPGQIPASQLGLAKSQGYTEAAAPPPEQQSVYDAAIDRGFSPTLARGLSIASPYMSWEQGVMGGATAGIAEGLQRKLAGVVAPIVSKAIGGPEMTQEQAEAYFKEIAQGGAHPLVHGAGEVAGLVGSTFAAPYLRGAGAAASGAGVVGRGLGLLSEAGSGAAAGARALTGGLAARGALGRAASTGAQFAAQGAIETGLYSGVHELSEEMFGKPEVSAEKILGAASDGAYGGAILGGALGAGGSLARSAVIGTRDIAQGIAAKNADALKGFADEQRWRALSPNKKFTAEAEARFPGGAKALGNLMGDEGLAGESFVQAAKEGDVATILGKADEAIARVGAEIGESRAASTATVKWGDIDDAIEKVAAPLRKSGLLSDKLAKVNEIRSQLAGDFLQESEAAQAVQRGEMTPLESVQAMRAHEIPLQDVVARRQILDDLFYQETKSLDPMMRVRLMRELRGNLEDTIMKSFGEAAEASGDKFARAALEDLKRRYQGLSIIRDTARSSAAGATSNRAVGLTDYVTAAAFGGGLKGLVAGAGNKFLRSKGNAMAAAAADRVAAFGGKARGLARLEEGAAEASAPEAAAATAVREEAPLAEAPVVEPPAPAPTMPEPPAKPVRPDSGPEPVLPVRSPAPAAPEGTFSERVNDAIHAADKLGKHQGLVPMSSLRAEFPELPKATFDKELEAAFRNKTVELKTIDNLKYASDAEKASMLSLSESRGPGYQSTQHYGFAVANEDPSGAAWQRAGSAKEHEAAQLAAEDKYIDDVNAWNAHDEALDEAHAKAMAEWQQKSAEHAEAADVAAKAAEFERVHRAIAHVDKQVDSAAKGLVTGIDSSAPFKASRSAGKDVYRSPFEATRALTAQYARARDDVNRLQQSAPVPRTSGLPSMPSISTAMAASAMRSTAYISSQLPSAIGSPSLGEDMPHLVTDADMHSFLEKYEVARNPMSAMRNISKGRISPDQVEALKVIYPELFSQLQVSALRQVRDRQAAGKPLSFETRQRLANLLEVHTDPSQEPEMAKLLQANIASSQQTKPDGAGPSAGPGKSVALPASLGATRYDRLESQKR